LVTGLVGIGHRTTQYWSKKAFTGLLLSAIMCLGSFPSIALGESLSHFAERIKLCSALWFQLAAIPVHCGPTWLLVLAQLTPI
jgi:hypothetical protein